MDWSKAPEAMVERIVRGGDAYLDGQLKLATSADQRASILAGVFTTAGTAIIAGLITLTTTHEVSFSQKFPIYFGGGAAAGLFLIAAALCIAAIFPVGFWLPGSQPESWYRDVEGGRELKDALCEEAENLQSKIAENRVVLATNAKRFRWGAALGIAAPLIGLLLWLISFFSVLAAAHA